MYYLEILYYKMYCFQKFIGQPQAKSVTMWFAPLPFGLFSLGTLLLLTKEEAQVSFILWLTVLFLPIFFFQILLRGKHDAIMEKFDKEPQEKKDRDNVLVFTFYVVPLIYFFSILFIYGPVVRK